MRKTKIGLSVACLAATVAVAPTALGQPQIIYDNTDNYLGVRTSLQNAELGDVVSFSPGSGRILTEFAFEYFMTSGTSGNETAQVFIRSVENGVIPDQILFQTTPFSITSGFNSVRVPTLDTIVGDAVAWTVLFSGFEGSEEVGLLFNNPPAIGSSPTFNNIQFSLQRNADGSFAFVDTPNVVDNLTARFTAVPEPTTWALILGGLAGFGLLRRRKA